MQIKIAATAVVALVAGGCAVERPSFIGRVDDPAAPMRAASYAPVMAGTQGYRPAEPKGWEELNRRVGPQGGGANER
ncbi:hypothetical protein [Terrarubrum flagellatum]|uniref:hypothetical protein n=1 Tax=Terrirubrum flagellatum TaxID=2895980 RepID=UPI0031452C4B